MSSAEAEVVKARARSALGIPLGETLERLIELAARIDPQEPAEAFGALWLVLLDAERLELEGAKPAAPAGVKVFAWTGGDGNCFGFLMDDPALPTDERPIVKICPMDDESSWEVVAPNLRGFLGLVAVAFAEVITRHATDDEWRRFRIEWYGDQPEILAEMEELSRQLLSLPGVTIPDSPTALACAAPSRSFSSVRQHDS